jgi:hypothetical protein
MTDDYRARLEALDVKRQRVHTQADLALVSRKAPGELNEDDLTQIGFWCGERAVTEARARREQALAPAPVTRSTAAPAYVTRHALTKEFEDYTKALGEILKEQKAQLDAQGAEIAALKAKPHVKFCGVWKAGGTYEPGDAATHQGGLWICKVATPGEPSKDFVGWQLAVKRGSV